MSPRFVVPTSSNSVPASPRTAPLHTASSQTAVPCSRRQWLTASATTLAAAAIPRDLYASRGTRQAAPIPTALMREAARHAAPLDAEPWETLARHAVNAALQAGASYADARLTRTVREMYRFQVQGQNPLLSVSESTGVSVRALVDGGWGFSAAPSADAGAVVSLARDAVAQAKVNARVTSGSVDMGRAPAATGRWTMPVTIDPFAMSIEEKWDNLAGWYAGSERFKPEINTLISRLAIARQERVLATSDGSLCTQTTYESDATIGFSPLSPMLTGLTLAGKGWELFADADIPTQLQGWLRRILEHDALTSAAKPLAVGRRTVVCDGATMASMVDVTLGTATQLDRALGYEANASGTSFLDDPLAMLGTLQVAAPNVTITANRSASGQLATVKWDDEGVAPEPFTVVKDGVLVDYQTNRELAAWLAPYYQRKGIPVRSHGCAGSQDALGIPLQRMPNLALTPAAGAMRTADLIASVADGLYLEGGVATADFQSRHGMVQGFMREIKNGRLGRAVVGGALLYDTADFWKKVSAIGGSETLGMIGRRSRKGQPEQMTSYTVTAPASIVTEQAFIDPSKKA